MTSIYIPSSTRSSGGELAGQVYGKTSNTIISTTAVTNKQLTGLTAMTGAVVASDSILTGISKLSGNAGAATSNNVVNQIVKRDATGGFSAGTIKATSLEVSGTTKIAMPLKDATGTNIINLDTNSRYGKTVMPALTTGTSNLGIGDNIMTTATSANANTFIGHNVAYLSTGNPSWNTAIGESAIYNVSGNNNTAVGHNAMRALTSGSNNVAIGVNAGHSANNVTTGSQNVLIGTLARLGDGTSTNAIAIGHQAQADGSNTIQLGNQSITSVKTNGTLYAAGLESIGTNSTLNIASANNTNTVNICSGTSAQTINMGSTGTGVTTINLGGGSDIVKINLPLKDSAGTSILNVVNNNCLVGAGSMPNVTAANNTSVGANAGTANVTGIGNTFIGYDSGKNGNGVGLTLNTAVGHSSLLVITEARDNTAVGHASLNAVTTGNSNTAIGKASGRGITTGGGNTFLGNYADL